MLFSVALFNCLLLAPAVLAEPSALGASVVRRQSQLYNRLEQTEAKYTLNWAGSIAASNGNFTWAMGEFIVPAPSGVVGASAAAWVGIDGATCHTAIFLIGVKFTVSSNGQPEYSVWYEWPPYNVHNFSAIPISAGDLVRLTVIALSPTSGKVRIDNLTIDKSSEKLQTFDTPLCGLTAEWIVEDFIDVPFANFTTVKFENAMAGGSGGIFNGSDGTLVDIQQGNQALTSTSASGWSVTIDYLG